MSHPYKIITILFLISNSYAQTPHINWFGRKLRYLISVLTLLLAVNLCAGQTTHFIHYGIEHGLPQSQVQTIEQDNDGNLWIGTMSGLSKYNGRAFINYTKKDSLAEDWITASCKDKAG